jgi:hypothetical protein
MNGLIPLKDLMVKVEHHRYNPTAEDAERAADLANAAEQHRDDLVDGLQALGRVTWAAINSGEANQDELGSVMYLSAQIAELVEGLTRLESNARFTVNCFRNPGCAETEGNSAAEPHDAATLDRLYEAAQTMLGTLSPREAEVIRKHFGIDTDSVHVHTGFRERKILDEALRKLRRTDHA